MTQLSQSEFTLTIPSKEDEWLAVTAQLKTDNKTIHTLNMTLHAKLSWAKRPQSHWIIVNDFNSQTKLLAAKSSLQVFFRKLGKGDWVSLLSSNQMNPLVVHSSSLGHLKSQLSHVSISNQKQLDQAQLILSQQLAKEHYIDGGMNHIIWLTDKDTAPMYQVFNKENKNMTMSIVSESHNAHLSKPSINTMNVKDLISHPENLLHGLVTVDNVGIDVIVNSNTHEAFAIKQITTDLLNANNSPELRSGMTMTASISLVPKGVNYDASAYTTLFKATSLKNISIRIAYAYYRYDGKMIKRSIEHNIPLLN